MIGVFLRLGVFVGSLLYVVVLIFNLCHMG